MDLSDLFCARQTKSRMAGFGSIVDQPLLGMPDGGWNGKIWVES
jgi:hypothetical protein